tara:strand:- start:324 stop:794 length:471 start_codon:yes stop_codon:yes gene_type:complete
MVRLTNLNRRLTTTDKVVQEGKNPAQFFTGPNKAGQDPFKPNPFFGKFDENPKNESFYQMFNDEQAAESQRQIDERTGFYGNTFEEGNNEFAQNFLNKYSSTLGGSNTAEGKNLIEPDRMVRPENLSQLSSQPAAGASGVQDPNVTGKFPSNQVNV